MADKTKTTKSLDAKITQALSANGAADRDTLANLINEATNAIEMAKVVIEAESPRFLDIANDTPDKSQELIASARLRVERLTKAITQLQARVDQIDHEAAVVKWKEDAKPCRRRATNFGETWRTPTQSSDQSTNRYLASRSTAIHAPSRPLRRRRPSGSRGISGLVPIIRNCATSSAFHSGTILKEFASHQTHGNFKSP